jgi:hypothetical protein
MTMIENEALTIFNFEATAELYSPRTAKVSRPLVYRRFATASAALQFAIEHLASACLMGTYLQVGDERYGSRDIRRLYDLHTQQLRPHHVAH